MKLCTFRFLGILGGFASDGVLLCPQMRSATDERGAHISSEHAQIVECRPPVRPILNCSVLVADSESGPQLFQGP